MAVPCTAEGLIRVTRSLAGAQLRAAYVRTVMREQPVACVAVAFDHVCRAAEQADVAAGETLIAIVDALHDAPLASVVQRLREEAVGQGFLSLERLLRQSSVAARSSSAPPAGESDRLPDYGKGRPLTLGERKSLARRNDPQLMARLLEDPHPEVIRRVLENPRITEEDVVRLAARRPGRGEVLAEIARATRWIHRARVRLAVLLNPDAPVDIVAPIAALLVVPELRQVAQSTRASPAVRALCLEYLKRRPPGASPRTRGPLQ